MAKIYTQLTALRTESTAGGGVNTAIEQLQGFTPSPATLPEIDVSDLSSTAAEFQGGLRDFGTASGTMFVDPTLTGQALLATMYGDATVRAWDLTLPSSIGVYTFDTYVSQMSLIGTIGVNQVMSGPFAIRHTGGITFT